MIFFSSLRRKLFTLLSISFFIILIVNFYLNSASAKERTFSYLKNTNQTIMKILSNTISSNLQNKEYGKIRKILSCIDNIYIQNIYILDSNGNIILDKSSSIKTTIKYPLYTTLLKEKSVVNDKQYLSIKVMKLLDSPIGFIVVQGDMNQYHTEINKEINLLIVYTIFFTLLSMLSSFFIAQNIAKPLEGIIAKLQRTPPYEKLSFDKQAQKEYQYLIEAIEFKHNSLYELNMHLEDEIATKTLELKNLNSSLEERVEEAILDIQQKEKLLKQQSRHAQIGEMIAMIAHQWRQPLSAISATAFSIIVKSKRKKFDLSSPESQDKHLQYLEKNLESIQGYVQFLSQTINDFRNFFKPEKLREHSLVNHLVGNALQIIKVPINNNNIEIKTKLDSVQAVKLFKNEITQAILNILKNSEDNFIEKKVSGGEIHITTYDQEKEIILEICDNGGGIDEDIIENIFDPYFSTKKEKNGSGLGLYMSKVIIEEHNHGKLQVENRDGGVCFIITFNL